MSHNWKGRDAWLDDEQALRKYYENKEEDADTKPLDKKESGQTMNFHLAILPPKATHQGSSMIMKRKDGSSFVGRPGNSPGAKAKKSLVQLLMAHAPEKPLEGPLRVSILVVWPWRKSEPKYRRALRAAPHFVKPDLDNYAKLLLDALADAAFFATGDQQESHLNLSKAWSDVPGIWFTIEPDEVE